MEFILATKNVDKVREFKRILEPAGITVISMQEADIDIEIEETGATFEENAKIKVKAIFDMTGKPCLADDSGICVDALDGAPGVYSARYAQTPNEAVTKLLENMKNVPDEKRSAHYECAISAFLPNGDYYSVTEICEGKIGYQRIGSRGFGYDPVFMIGDKSLAEYSDVEKDAVSHRGKALEKFAKKIILLAMEQIFNSEV